MPTHIFSLENKRMSKSEAATTSTNQVPSTSRSTERPPSTTSVQPANVNADQGSDKDKTYPASSRAPVSTASSNFKFTNHERTLLTDTAGTVATTSTSTATGKLDLTVDQPNSIKLSLANPTSAELAGLPSLRRVKTEASTLSTKEYFERKQREQQDRDRDRAAANIMQLKSEVTATGEMLQSPPCKMAKLEISLSKLPDRITSEHMDRFVGSVHRDKFENSSAIKVDAGAKSSVAGSPMIASRMPKAGAEISSAAVKNLGMGDSSDHRSSNIFDRMRGSETKPKVAASTSENFIPQHNRPGDVNATVKSELSNSSQQPIPTTAAENFMYEMSSSGERSKLDRRMHSHVENSTDSAFVIRPTERRRSSRRDSGAGTPLQSPNKLNNIQTGSDFGSPIPVIGGHGTGDSRAGGHKRKRSADSEHQPSPLKLKLSVPPAVAGPSHTNSPPKHHAMAGHSSHHPRVAGPSSSVDQVSGAAFSESLERIRLKVSLSEGRVEKLNSSEGKSSPAGVSGVKIVLSKDKLSGAYQSGSNAPEQRRHHHHHHHGDREHDRHQHRSQKHHSQQQQSDSDNGQQVAKNSIEGLQRPRSHQRTDSGSASRMPPEKHQRSSASSYGNGHHGNPPSSSMPYAASRQVQVMQQPNSLSSTYRYAAMAAASIPPPPPPPPLPSDDPFASQPPLPPQ